MKVIIVKDYHELSAKAARFVLAQIWRKPDSVLGLPTGSTPLGLYRKLASAFKKDQVDFKNITTFNLDEYSGIKASDPASYHTYMQNHLFRHINVKKSHVNIPPALAGDSKKAAAAYETAIKAAHGLDLVILGIGVNGHIGFNEPGTSFNSTTHLSELSEATKQQNVKYFLRRPQPNQAMTMGLATIMKAKEIVILASGTTKAEAVAMALEGKIDAAVPASILQQHANVTWIIDEAAAKKLKHSYRSPLLFSEGDIELLTESDWPRNKEIVVVSPHPDDASISLGGAIWALARHNSVYIVVATTGYRSVVAGTKPEAVIAIREQEARQESKVLGARPIFLRAEFYDARASKQAQSRDAKRLATYFKKIKPNIVFMPSHKDQHPTHRVVRSVALAALAQATSQRQKLPQLWEYEGLWSMFSEGDFNTIFAYDDKIMKHKLKAIALQRSQIARTR
ncbi:MAG: glucosamine-6-phosphate deaminase, partial [Candidatus Komeilibacteria bacterium]|nr:glucosamine-6-phosphate deaminase [Candidatus Komeilibacteria bacterium]